MGEVRHRGHRVRGALVSSEGEDMEDAVIRGGGVECTKCHT